MDMQATSYTLWQMVKDGHSAECAIASSPVGVEGQVLLDGRVLAAYQFGTETEAVVWANDKRTDMASRAWTLRWYVRQDLAA
jgi:hypothetical protein